MDQQDDFQWYAVQVRSQHEDLVARHLRVRGMEAFLPLYKERHRWSDRFVEIDVPLFPGYVFSQFNPLNRLPVLTVPGVVHIVGTGKKLLPVDKTEIDAIQAAVRSEVPRQPWPFLQIGNKVKIEFGPLCGIEGILLAHRGHQRLVLSITLLQRSVAVQIDEEWVRPLSPAKPSSSKQVASEHVSPRPAA